MRIVNGIELDDGVDEPDSWELVTGQADDETEDRATCPECGELHHPSYHEDEICDKCADKMCEQVPCEILGCDKMASEAQMRTFRLGDAPVKCCPECWDAMELPRDLHDTRQDACPPAETGYACDYARQKREKPCEICPLERRNLTPEEAQCLFGHNGYSAEYEKMAAEIREAMANGGTLSDINTMRRVLNSLHNAEPIHGEKDA